MTIAQSNRHRHRLERASQLTRSTRFCAIRKLSPARRSACVWRPAKMRCWSSRYSTMITVELTTYSPFAVVGLLDHHVADEMHGARRRRLDVDARMLEPVDPRLHEVAVVVEQRDVVERALLVGRGRHPVGRRPRRTAPSSRGSAAHRGGAPRCRGTSSNDRRDPARRRLRSARRAVVHHEASRM